MQDKLAVLKAAFPKKGTLDPRVIGCHEAAHMIVGEVLGKPLVDVRFDGTPGRPAVPEMKWPAEVDLEQRPRRDASIFMAGPLMDQMLTGKIDMTDFDHQQAQLALKFAGMEGAEMIAALKTAGAQALKIIDARLEDIMKLGLLLVTHKHLSRGDLATSHKMSLFSQE